MADDERFKVETVNEKRQVELNQVNVHLVRLTPLTSPPEDLRDGDLWVTSGGAVKIRLLGVTKTFTVT